MTSAVLLHLLVYAGVAVFVAAVAYRAYRIQSMPMHLRWELYPVAHEAGDKARYGGSALEELDWWTKPKESSLFNELRYMIPEMTLLVALFEHNRKLWWRSFPFHFGLYILAGMVGLIVLGALMELGDVYVGPVTDSQAIGLGVLVYYLTQAAALFGLSLCTAGAAGLLERRLTDPELRGYTSFGHVFNLLFFLAALVLAWLTFIFIDTNFSMTRSWTQSALTFNLNHAAGHPLLAAEIAVAIALVAYIPLTHMSHFFIKWFTYHQVRWEDAPNVVGGAVEAKVMKQVQYPVTWAASHIKGGGKKNWVDIATEDLEELKK